MRFRIGGLMVESTTSKSLFSIKNPAFRAYARSYDGIERDFMAAVRSFGLGFAEESEDVTHGKLSERVDALEARGAYVENDRKSIHLNWISPACITCRKGVGTETFLTSTQCPRNCYFCFNPNQADYEYYLTHVHDVAGELRQRHAAGVKYRDLALTGGEPLLHADRTVAFFKRAAKLYPKAYTRLYTSGWRLDEALLSRLQSAGLSEIRFSVKLEESQASIDEALAQMEMCVGHIPSVMVEMPVMPDQVDQMKELLVRLNAIGIQGINLLELCFPMANAPEFAKRGYKIKAKPYRVLYNYVYAGGLPIDGSEAACIELLEFAADEGLSLGVHYCSLENKFSGQVYRQNSFIDVACPWHVMSERDYFLKSAKVFGRDVEPVGQVLHAMGERRMERNDDHRSLEFPLEVLPELAETMPDIEVAVCYSIAEHREQGDVLRELAVFKTTPATFDSQTDL